MPRLITQSTQESEAAREVSEAQYEGLRTGLRRGNSDGQMVADITDPPDSMRLWDVIEQAWTKPLPRSMVLQVHSRKGVFKCSVCSYTTISNTGGNTVAMHVEKTFERAKEHEGATVMDVVVAGQAGKQCSSCEAKSVTGPGKVVKHLAQVIELASAHHAEVTEQLMKRFSLGPSEPVVVQEVVVKAATNGHRTGPSATVERMPERRLRRRRRGKNRGRAHGDTNSRP